MSLQVQQLVGVVNGSVMYNVTPSVIMSEWHTLSATSMNYGSTLQNWITKLGQTNSTAWTSERVPVHLSQILITRLELFLLAKIGKNCFTIHQFTYKMCSRTIVRTTCFFCVFTFYKTGVWTRLKPLVLSCSRAVFGPPWNHTSMWLIGL